jgi:hypothetical protein
MREAEFYNPPACCADLVPAFPNTNLSPSALCVLNHSSINQRLENLLCTHKLHTPDLAHLALKPFALLIRYLVGTRNHQAQLLFLLRRQHSQGPHDRSHTLLPRDNHSGQLRKIIYMQDGVQAAYIRERRWLQSR